MQIISTINSFVQLQGTSYYKKKKLHILSWKITGKLYKHFPGLSRTYKQNSRTFQNLQTKFKDFPGQQKKSRTFPGCGNPVDCDLISKIFSVQRVWVDCERDNRTPLVVPCLFLAN